MPLEGARGPLGGLERKVAPPPEVLGEDGVHLEGNGVARGLDDAAVEGLVLLDGELAARGARRLARHDLLEALEVRWGDAAGGFGGELRLDHAAEVEEVPDQLAPHL